MPEMRLASVLERFYFDEAYLFPRGDYGAMG